MALTILNKQKPLPKSFKTKIKLLANPGPVSLIKLALLPKIIHDSEILKSGEPSEGRTYRRRIKFVVVKTSQCNLIVSYFPGVGSIVCQHGYFS